MTKNSVWALTVLTLSGCAGYPGYKEVAQTPAPQGIAGVWMSTGPQKTLVDPAALATLIVNRAGDTLDCRQWQRTLVRYGKLTWRGDALFNVNDKNEYNKITRTGDVIHYGSLTMRRVEKPTVECQAYTVYQEGDYVFPHQVLTAKPAVAKSHTKTGGVERRQKSK